MKPKDSYPNTKRGLTQYIVHLEDENAQLVGQIEQVMRERDQLEVLYKQLRGQVKQSQNLPRNQ